MIYEFRCNNDKCEVEIKEINCAYEEIEQIRCECGEKMERIYSVPNIFTNDRFNK